MADITSGATKASDKTVVSVSDVLAVLVGCGVFAEGSCSTTSAVVVDAFDMFSLDRSPDHHKGDVANAIIVSVAAIQRLFRIDRSSDTFNLPGNS